MESNEKQYAEGYRMITIKWVGTPLTKDEMDELVITKSEHQIELCSCPYPYGEAGMIRFRGIENMLMIDPFKIQHQFGIKPGGYGVSFCGIVKPTSGIQYSDRKGLVAFSVYSDPRYAIIHQPGGIDTLNDDPTFPMDMLFISNIVLDLDTMKWEFDM